MKTFLTLKHWQIFLMLFVFPFIFEVVIILALIVGVRPMPVTTLLPVFIMLIMALYLGLLYSYGINLYSRLRETAGFHLSWFKFFLFLFPAYITILMAFVLLTPSLLANSWFFLLIGFTNMICGLFSLYVPYFIAKALKSVELRRSVSFSDYAGEFFLLLFYPIGVWFIQPRINRIFSSEEDYL